MERRAPAPPETLTRQMIALLGDDANADAFALPEICVAASARALERLLADARFARESATELLAIDALTTYAFEYASATPDASSRLAALTERAAVLLGQLTPLRV